MTNSERADLAKAVLENPVFLDAMAHVKREALLAIAQTKPNEGIERERLYTAVKVWEHAEQFLMITIANGESEKIANKQTDQIQTLGKKSWM